MTAIENSRRWFAASSVQSGLVARILSFASLPHGWHYGSGSPAKISTVVNALMVRTMLVQLGAKQVEAFPIKDGGILVSGINLPDVVDVTCHVSGSLTVSIERGGEEVAYKDDVSSKELAERVKFLEWKDQLQSDSVTLSTIPTFSDASRAKQSKPPTTVSLWSMRPVPLGSAEANANTFRVSTTAGSVGRRQYSSGLTSATYLPGSHFSKMRRKVMIATS
jgi:hypothetical protein